MTRKSHALADRMSHIDASGIRKVFDLAAKLTDPVDLSIGQPDFDVPEPAKQAAIEAILRGQNRYTPTQGIPQSAPRWPRCARGNSAGRASGTT